MKEATVELNKVVQFMIEIDRRGCNQAVFYDCGNEEFKNYILNFGFKEEFGTFSDISILSPAYDIASVNLSAGYYNEHTKQEYISLKDLQNTIDLVLKILKDKNRKFYDYQEAQHFYKQYCYENEKDLMRSDFKSLSDDEFYEYYGVSKPKTEYDLELLVETYFGY